LIRSIALLGSSGVMAAGVNFLALPLLTRLYAPEDFGTWAVILAIVSVIGGLSTLRYEVALVLPESHETAAEIYWATFGLCLLAGVLAGLLVAQPAVAVLLGLGGETGSLPIAWLIGAGVWSLGWYQLNTHWLIRLSNYPLQGLGLLILALGVNGSQLILFYLWFDNYLGLLIGSIGGQLLVNAVLFGWLVVNRSVPAFPRSLKGVPGALRAHSRFPIYSMPLILAGLLRERGMLLLLDTFFSRELVGAYAVVMRLLNVPVSIVAQGARPVFFNAAASGGVQGVGELVEAAVRVLTVIGIPLIAAAVFVPEFWLSTLLGDAWAGADQLLVILIMPAFMLTICNWMDRILDVAGQMKWAMAFEILQASTSTGVLFALLASGADLLVSLSAYAAVMVLTYLVYLRKAFLIVNRPYAAVFRLLTVNVAMAAVVSGVAIVAQGQVHPLLLAAALALCGATYAAASWRDLKRQASVLARGVADR
jgi:lipopolysaccharide exporter